MNTRTSLVSMILLGVAIAVAACGAPVPTQTPTATPTNTATPTPTATFTVTRTGHKTAFEIGGVGDKPRRLRGADVGERLERITAGLFVAGGAAAMAVESAMPANSDQRRADVRISVPVFLPHAHKICTRRPANWQWRRHRLANS